jgi:glycosyltransferase involved in cell wall biosynthesis
MRELVYISANVPRAIQTYTHGIWQRQQLFIDALSPMFDRVRCIFWKDLGPGEFEDDDEISERAKAAFSNDVSVTVLEPASYKADPGYVDYYAKSILLGPAGLGHRRVIDRHATAQLAASLPDTATAIFAQGLEVMATVARLRRRLPAVFWDLADLETLKHLRELRITPWSKGKPLLYLHSLGLLAEERRAARAADLGFVCSDVDRRRAIRFLGGDFRTAPNAVKVPQAPMAIAAGPPTVLFVGFFGYEPNRDAADWFVDEIWPRVLQQMPEACLRIAGSRPDRLHAYGKPLRSVDVLGFVPELEPEYARSHVFVCPIRSGSGTRVKLLEAAAYARPIVSTRLGAEGIEFVDGQSALLADGTKEFADACVQLLADRDRSSRIGRSAWHLMREQYGRESVILRIRDDVAMALKRDQPAVSGVVA